MTTYPLMRCLTCDWLQTFSSRLVRRGMAEGWCVRGHQANWILAHRTCANRRRVALVGANGG